MIERVNLTERQPEVAGVHAGRAASPNLRESFDAVLRKELGKIKEVTFSAHALSRIESRNIRLGASEQARIAEAVDRAQAKGARESLVLLDEAALVVSVRNRTVVTILDRAEMRGTVFTNIDSAIVMGGA